MQLAFEGGKHRLRLIWEQQTDRERERGHFQDATKLRGAVYDRNSFLSILQKQNHCIQNITDIL